MDYIKKIEEKDKKAVNDFLQKEWGNTVIVLREGEIYDLKDEAGFVI
mgnify:CR=1 FL=1